jgi:magnesium-transporting ATPase (P-type)
MAEPATTSVTTNEPSETVEKNKPATPEDNRKMVEIQKQLIVPIVLIIVAVLLILVSAIFVSITYYQFQKSKSTLNLNKNASNLLLAALIIIWIAFVVALILLGVNYYNYNGAMKNTNVMFERKNNGFLWLTVFIVAILTLITGLICLYLSFLFKVLSNSLFTNILVATVTALGGFAFVLIGAVYYGFNSGKLFEFYDEQKKKLSAGIKTYRSTSTSTT